MSKVHYVKNVNSNAPTQPHIAYINSTQLRFVSTHYSTEKSVLYLKSVLSGKVKFKHESVILELNMAGCRKFLYNFED